MREIKFRAWDTESKIMFDWDEMQEWWEEVGYYDNMLRGNHYVPMQYTELKDKNGKEIYEGDIMKEEDGEIGVVKFGIHSNMIDRNSKNIGFYIEFPTRLFFRKELGFWSEVCEIIGNIYENPELIGGE